MSCAPVFDEGKQKPRHLTQGMDFLAVRKEISEELKQAELRSVTKFKSSLKQKNSKLLNAVKSDMLQKRDKIRKFMKDKTQKHSGHNKQTVQRLSGTITPGIKIKRPARKSVDLTRKYTALRQDITPSRIFE